MHDAEIFPLLGNMRKLNYSYGEYILREGEIPQGMYVIKEGQCLVCVESIGARSVKKLPFAKNDPRTLFESEDSSASGKKSKPDGDLRVKRGFNNNVLYNDERQAPLANHVIYHNIVLLDREKKYGRFRWRACTSTRRSENTCCCPRRISPRKGSRAGSSTRGPLCSRSLQIPQTWRCIWSTRKSSSSSRNCSVYAGVISWVDKNIPEDQCEVRPVQTEHERVGGKAAQATIRKLGELQDPAVGDHGARTVHQEDQQWLEAETGVLMWVWMITSDNITRRVIVFSAASWGSLPKV